MAIDYPDFSRVQSEAGQQLGSFLGQKQNDPTTGVMDCIGYAYLTIEIGDKLNVHNFTVVVTWYSDRGGTNILNTSTIGHVPGSVISYQIPAVSRYARVTASHVVFGDTEMVGCIVNGSNVVVPNTIVGPQIEPFIRNSATVNAASSQFINALFTTWGPATFSWFTDEGTSCVIQVEYFTYITATFVPLHKVHLPAGVSEGSLRISLPPNPTRVGLYNNAGVAKTFTGTVTLG